MFVKKAFRNHSSDLITLSIVFPAFFWLTYCLFRGLAENIFSLKNLDLIIWIFTCIIQILGSRKKILYPSTNAIAERQTEHETYSKHKPGVLITLVILGLPLIPLIVILGLNIDTLTAFYVSEPEFESFSNYSNIFFALMLITSNLQDLFNIKKNIYKQIIALSSAVLGLAGMVMLFIYTSHINEAL